ncbi:MAG: hypothetical protein V8S81_06465 [Oscillospiraceae bacterium]
MKYEYKGDVPTGALAQLPADETHKMHTDVTVAAEPKLGGYVFSGWTTTDAAVSSDGKFKMPGQNVTLTGSWTIRSDLSYTVNYYWNGTEEPVAPSKTVDGQTFGARITDEVPISVDGYTAVSANQTCDLTIGTGTEINFYYYKNVTLTANSGTAVYDGDEHTATGYTSYPAQFQGMVGTVDATENSARYGEGLHLHRRCHGEGHRRKRTSPSPERLRPPVPLSDASRCQPVPEYEQKLQERHVYRGAGRPADDYAAHRQSVL